MATPSTPPSFAPGFGGTTAPPPPRAFDEPESAGRYIRGTLAAFLFVAAAIHFAFAPDHFAEDWKHGTFFIVAGWLQLGLAVLLLSRPRRWVLGAAILTNLVVIGAWVWSRTAGLPTWAGGNGEAEAVGNTDLLCTVLEGMIVIGSAALLLLPDLARKPIGDVRVASALAASAITLALVGASFGINPANSGHSHAGGGHGEEAAAGDHHGASSSNGHDDEHSAVSGGASGEHSMEHGAGGSETHTVGVPWETGQSPCEQATKGADPEESPAGQGHNHHGPLPQKAITPEDQKALIEEQKQARAVIAKYPTVKDALADGYAKSTDYVPCIGAHYTKISLVAKFDPSAPSELLYDGTAPDAKIIGLSYLIFHPGGMPDGFTGPNDVWHQHSSNGGLCLNRQGVVVGGEQTSPEECEKRGGRKNSLKDIWMVHDWVAPGWDCSWGVFAAECPELGGKLGGTAFDPIS